MKKELIRIKSGKFFWLVLGGGIGIVTLIAMGISYIQQVRSQNEVRSNVNYLKAKVSAFEPARLIKQRENLHSQIDQIEAGIAEISASLNEPLEIVDITTWIYWLADREEIAITHFSSSGHTRETIAQVKFDSMPLSLTVEGTFSRINRFIADLNREFPTAVVRSAEMTVLFPEKGETDSHPIPSSFIDKAEAVIHFSLISTGSDLR